MEVSNRLRSTCKGWWIKRRFCQKIARSELIVNRQRELKVQGTKTKVLVLETNGATNQGFICVPMSVRSALRGYKGPLLLDEDKHQVLFLQNGAIMGVPYV